MRLIGVLHLFGGGIFVGVDVKVAIGVSVGRSATAGCVVGVIVDNDSDKSADLVSPFLFISLEELREQALLKMARTVKDNKTKITNCLSLFMILNFPLERIRLSSSLLG